MSVLLDSSVVIDILRVRQEAIKYARSLLAVPFCSEITRVEVLRGVRRPERRKTEQFFGLVRWLPIDETISRRAGELGLRLGRTYPGLAVADLIIAATALELELELATLNVRHFPMFKRLRPPF